MIRVWEVKFCQFSSLSLSSDNEKTGFMAHEQRENSFCLSNVDTCLSQYRNHDYLLATCSNMFPTCKHDTWGTFNTLESVNRYTTLPLSTHFPHIGLPRETHRMRKLPIWTAYPPHASSPCRYCCSLRIGVPRDQKKLLNHSVMP